MRRLLYLLLICFSSVALATTLEEARQASERGDYKAALEILRTLAEKGDPDALANIGNMYAFGRGVEKNLSIAASYWKRAAEKGVGTAIGNIAILYKTGQGGLPKDDALAAAWYKRAAEHRHVPSMITLSSLYMLGEGIEVDRLRALAWAGLAASNTPSPRPREAATAQVRKIAQGMTSDEIQKAQELSDELRRLIDANVARYKAQ